MSNIYANNINPRSGSTVTFPQNIKVLGTATYEDVANVDSVGIITAQSGVIVGADPANSGSSNPQGINLNTNGYVIIRRDSSLKGLFLGPSGTSDYKVRIGTGGEANFMGNVGVGTDNPVSKLDILHSTSTNTATENLIHLRTDPAASYASRGLFVKIGRDGDYDNSAAHYDIVGSAGNSGFHAFEVQGSEKLRLTKDGKLILSMTERSTPHGAQGDGAMFIEQSYDGNLYGLMLRNKDTGSNAATSLGFSLNRSGGDQDFEAGQIKLIKEQSWTTSSATVDGAMVFSTIESGSMAPRLRINSAGNITIGEKTDPVWHSSVDALTVGYAACLYEDSYADGGVAGRNNYVVFGNNTYYPASGGNTYINNDEASRIMMNGGDFYFDNASSGTAGNAIAFNTRLKITSDGDLIQKERYSTYTNHSSVLGSATRTLTITGLRYGTATIHFGGSDGNGQYVHFKINLGGHMWGGGNGYNAEVSGTGYSGGSYSVTKNNTSYVISITAGSNPMYYSYTFKSTSYTSGNYATIAET